MRLANTWRSKKNEILGVMNELQRSYLFNRRLINRRLKLEIKISSLFSTGNPANLILRLRERASLLWRSCALR